MLRKLTIAAVGGAVTLTTVGVMAPGAFGADPEPKCAGLATNTIYRASDLKRNKFDLAFSPKTAFADAQVSGAAIVCGTNSTDGASERYIDRAIVTTAGKGESVRCANSASTTPYCAGQGDADLADNTPTGTAVADIWCDKLTGIIEIDPCSLAGVPDFNNDIGIVTKVAYDTGTGGGNQGGNRCGADAVACFVSGANISGSNCDSDVITRNPDGIGKKFTLTISPPDCSAVAGFTPHVWLVAIENLTLCKYAGASNCSSADTSQWVQRNGQVTPVGTKYKYLADVVWTDGSAPPATAKAKFSWTP